MTDEEKWNHRRAITGFLEIAETALQAANAIAPEASTVVDAVYEARMKVAEALRRAEMLWP